MNEWMNEWKFIYLKSGTFVNDKYLYKEGKSALIGSDNMLRNSLVQIRNKDTLSFLVPLTLKMIDSCSQ